MESGLDHSDVELKVFLVYPYRPTSRYPTFLPHHVLLYTPSPSIQSVLYLLQRHADRARRRAGAGSDLEAGELWRPKAVQSFGRPCNMPCNMTCKVNVLNKGICGSMWGICMEYEGCMQAVCREYVYNIDGIGMQYV